MFNVNFQLSVDDVELIESALRQSKKELATQLMETDTRHNEIVADDDEKDEAVRQIHDLLGRLHNQKVFYRPRKGAYIGG